MNLRTLNTSDNVEELRRQIESALGSVEEIVKNKAVISVATEPEQDSQQDEVVVYVSIKIKKNQEREGQDQHLNGNSASNGVNGTCPASNGEAEAERPGKRKVRTRTEDCEVTGQAIQPRRRGRGAGGRLGRSSTAPSTPVRSRAANLRTSSGQQTKSLEVRHQTVLFIS